MSDESLRIVSQLKAALQGGPRLRLALLFGSGAKDQLRPDSDLDIGIVPVDADLTLGDELALATRLCRATGREVDLVRLDRAPAIVRWQAVEHHVPLLADPPESLPRFVAAAALEHADMQPLLDDARRRLARRLAGGAP